jgi:methyl-accepting chemotaxis protein
MRAFLNLSVGRKLAVSGAVAFLMVGGILASMHWTGSAIEDLVRRQARIDTGAETLAVAQRTVAEVPLHAQRIAIAQTGPAIDAALTAAQANIEQTIRLTREASPLIEDADAARILAEAVTRAEAFGAVMEEVARLRRSVIQARDDAFLRARRTTTRPSKVPTRRSSSTSRRGAGGGADALHHLPPGLERHARLGAALPRHRRRTDGPASAPRQCAGARASARRHLARRRQARARPRNLSASPRLPTEAGEGAVATIDQGRTLNASLIEGRTTGAQCASIAAFAAAECTRRARRGIRRGVSGARSRSRSASCCGMAGAIALLLRSRPSR